MPHPTPPARPPVQRRPPLWRAAAAVCLLALCSACGADGDDDDTGPLDTASRARIDAIVQQQIQAEQLPGTVVGVWIGGQRHVTAQGVADLVTGRARVVDDLLRIASITKTFIGTAALVLVDRGALARTDTLDRWYPGFPNAASITVADLLRMRSGIPDSADQGFLEEYWNDPLLPLDAEAMIARAAARGAEAVAPDTVTRYTNVNFMLLERIVEQVSGQDIRSFLDREIARPLGLAHTSYPRDAVLPGALRGYGRATQDGPLQDRTQLDPRAAGGAGAMVSTLEDLRIYTRALCRGDLLRPQTQAERLRPTVLENEPDFIGYGEGLARIGRFCGHNGTIFGFSTEVWYLPEADATIVVSVNRLDLDDASKSFNTFALVAKALFPTLVDW